MEHARDVRGALDALSEHVDTLGQLCGARDALLADARYTAEQRAALDARVVEEMRYEDTRARALVEALRGVFPPHFWQRDKPPADMDEGAAEACKKRFRALDERWTSQRAGATWAMERHAPSAAPAGEEDGQREEGGRGGVWGVMADLRALERAGMDDEATQEHLAQLEEDVVGLLEIMRELQRLVAMQQVDVDVIEQHVEEAAAVTREGVAATLVAAEYKFRVNKLRLALVGAAVGILALGPVGLAVGAGGLAAFMTWSAVMGLGAAGGVLGGAGGFALGRSLQQDAHDAAVEFDDARG